jgi:hypothetical protein
MRTSGEGKTIPIMTILTMIQVIIMTTTNIITKARKEKRITNYLKIYKKLPTLLYPKPNSKPSKKLKNYSKKMVSPNRN